MRILIILFLVFFITLTIALIAGKCGSALDKAVPSLPAIAEAFTKGKITQTFISSIPKITSTNGDILEVAHYDATEILNRRDSKSIFWGAVPLGENVVEIRVPATYRYHIRLSDKWQLDVTGNTCIVYAPAIRPSQPPAIHTDKMEKLVLQRGWARFDADRTLEDLERSITPEMEKRAASSNYINLVREASRQSVAEFVKTWLMQNKQWSNNTFNTIKVIFPDEKDKMQSPDVLQPTIQFGKG